MTQPTSHVTWWQSKQKGKGERDPWNIALTPAPRREAPLPDETQVDAQGPVAPRAVNAQEYPVGDAGPAGVLGTAVKTHLKEKFKTQSPIDPYLPDQPSSRTIQDLAWKLLKAHNLNWWVEGIPWWSSDKDSAL